MFNNIFKNKKILITGNTGFKGSWLTVWLLKLEAIVYGISKGIPTKPAMFEILNLRNKINYYEFDLRELGPTIKLIKEVKPDYIFHLAAQSLVYTSYNNPIDTITTNVIGTANVLEALKQSNHVCTAIIITSDKCYDNVEWLWGYKETDILGGKDIYSGSKGAAELIIHSYFHSFFKDTNKSNVKILSTRAGNVIGGGDWAEYRIIPDCVKAWSKGKKVKIRSPRATRPWQHVLEPLSGYLTAAEALVESSDLNGESFNFGPNTESSKTVEEIISDLSREFKFSTPNLAISVINKQKYHEARLLKLNCDKALYYLKWLPTLQYNDLIKFTGEWYYRFYFLDQANLYDFTEEQIRSYEKNAFQKGINWAQ